MADHEHDDDRDETAAEDRTQAETAARDRRQAREQPAEAEAVDPAELRRELERLRVSLKETNRKATADRLRREELEREKADQEEAKLGESERLKKQLRDASDRAAALEKEAAELREARIRDRIDREIEREAQLTFEYPQDVPKLVDRARIDYDPETDKVLGVKEAVDRLAKDRPGLQRLRPGGGTPPRDAAAYRRNGPANPADRGLAPEDRAARQLIESGGYGRF